MGTWMDYPHIFRKTFFPASNLNPSEFGYALAIWDWRMRAQSSIRVRLLPVNTWYFPYLQSNINNIFRIVLQYNTDKTYRIWRFCNSNHNILFFTDLGRMYKLVSRISWGLGELKNLLEQHIHSQGDHALGQCADAAINVSVILPFSSVKFYPLTERGIVLIMSVFCHRRLSGKFCD